MHRIISNLGKMVRLKPACIANILLASFCLSDIAKLIHARPAYPCSIFKYGL